MSGKKQSVQNQKLSNRCIAAFEAALDKRQSLFTQTNALRLVNSHGDFIPGIVVEQYHRHFAVHQFAEAASEDVLAICDHIAAKFAPEYLVVKPRNRLDGKEYSAEQAKVLINRNGSRSVVTEHGVLFAVDLNDTMNTGLFLDMRQNRQLVARQSQGKEVLNCFAYTCSFGVHCRAANAARVVNVDISAKILERGKENYALNALGTHEHEFVRADTIRYLAGALKHENRFDCIVLDPPTFSRHDKEVFSVSKEIPGILDKAFSLLKPQGTILAATNCSKIPPEILKTHIYNAAHSSGKEIIKITRLGQDVDFPGSNTMKESFLSCYLVKIG